MYGLAIVWHRVLHITFGCVDVHTFGHVDVDVRKVRGLAEGGETSTHSPGEGRFLSIRGFIICLFVIDEGSGSEGRKRGSSE
jgi:hypothetical protein